mmetsp:Transcript_36736/g.95420  ORF Transcript_36736/g.95420 Transcript_36736/m.95420 type:complete len:82 (-) Transcript_36736:138-383(-)
MYFILHCINLICGKVVGKFKQFDFGVSAEKTSVASIPRPATSWTSPFFVADDEAPESHPALINPGMYARLGRRRAYGKHQH